MNPIKIIKNRSDIGAGTRGSDMGIDAIEIAAINVKNDFFNVHPYADVKTHNETIYNKNKNTFAKRINFVCEQCQRLRDEVKKELKKGFFPLILSGDHSSALGSLSGIQMAYPDKEIGVIWLDAHADIHTPYSTPSGNVHGMPIAAALSIDNREFSKNKVSESTEKNWLRMKNMGDKSPLIKPENLIYFGVRDTEKEEDQIIQSKKIKNFSVNEVRGLGLKSCIDQTIQQLISTDLIYISFDVDALDCDLFSRGTGTPVSKGFVTKEIISIIKGVKDTGKLVALEICEINPLLDNKGNQMAESSFEIISSVFS
ncbi:MAG: arginase [Flavobacteriaceae bacterium]|nr:arginase [Flavobacteriaceae bacterium]|tara:strand:- start:19045 stop:19983 length:939 start_codon:yes stop_codon:yes gene_type:complete